MKTDRKLIKEINRIHNLMMENTCLKEDSKEALDYCSSKPTACKQYRFIVNNSKMSDLYSYSVLEQNGLNVDEWFEIQNESQLKKIRDDQIII